MKEAADQMKLKIIIVVVALVGWPPVARALNFFELEVYPATTEGRGVTEIESLSNFVAQGRQPTEEEQSGEEVRRHRLLRSSLELNYGLTDKIDVAVYTDLERANGEAVAYAGSRVRARGALWDQGRFPVDVGWYVEAEMPHDDPAELEFDFRTLFSRDFGRFTVDLNPAFELPTVASERRTFEFNYGARSSPGSSSTAASARSATSIRRASRSTMSSPSSTRSRRPAGGSRSARASASRGPATRCCSRPTSSTSSSGPESRELRGEPEEAPGVGRRRLGHGRERLAAHGGHGLGDHAHERGLVAPAAVRHGREVRRIGLDEEALGGHEAHRRAQRLGVLERHDARHRDGEAQVEVAARVGGVAGEAVDDAAHGVRALGAQQLRRLGVRLADVDDEGPAVRAGERHVAGESRALCRARRAVIVVVEAGLADGDDAGCGEPAREGGEGVVVGGVGVVGVHADGRDDRDLPVAAGERHGGRVALDRARGADADERRYPRGGRPGEHGGAVRVEGGLRHVAVRVDERGHVAGSSTRGKSGSAAAVRCPAGKASPHGRSRRRSTSEGSPSRRTRRAAVSGRKGETSCAVTRSASQSSWSTAPARARPAGSLTSVNGAVSTTYLLA